MPQSFRTALSAGDQLCKPRSLWEIFYIQPHPLNLLFDQNKSSPDGGAAQREHLLLICLVRCFHNYTEWRERWWGSHRIPQARKRQVSVSVAHTQTHRIRCMWIAFTKSNERKFILLFSGRDLCKNQHKRGRQMSIHFSFHHAWVMGYLQCLQHWKVREALRRGCWHSLYCALRHKQTPSHPALIYSYSNTMDRCSASMIKPSNHSFHKSGR